MDINLFKAILAMDAYNRGYGSGISILSDTNGTQIGSATIFDKMGDAEAQSQGFYAIAYNYNSETIIAYRGTDSNSILPWSISGSDLLNGYWTGAGYPMDSQAYLAVEFYKTVAASLPTNADISPWPDGVCNPVRNVHKQCDGYGSNSIILFGFNNGAANDNFVRGGAALTSYVLVA